MDDRQANSDTPQSTVYDQQLETLVGELVSIDLAGPSRAKIGDAAEPAAHSQNLESVADDPSFLLQLQERVGAALAAGETTPDASELIDQAIDAWLASR